MHAQDGIPVPTEENEANGQICDCRVEVVNSFLVNFKAYDDLYPLPGFGILVGAIFFAIVHFLCSIYKYTQVFRPSKSVAKYLRPSKSIVEHYKGIKRLVN
jgi:hypothetical protein